MPTTEPCGTPSPCLLPPPPTRRRPPLRSPPRRCHCTARREHAASRSRVHQDIHPLGGQASIVQRRKRQDPPRRRHRFCGRGRGGRLTVRRGCSSPERTFRPLDVRVESASRLMSSPPRRLCEQASGARHDRGRRRRRLPPTGRRRRSGAEEAWTDGRASAAAGRPRKHTEGTGGAAVDPRTDSERQALADAGGGDDDGAAAAAPRRL